MLVGGDFNLIRGGEDKNSGGVDSRLTRAFNEFIGKAQLREIYRGRGGFTWSNKQASPILSNLDIFLVSTDWEENFPLATVTSLTRIGSDHTPLMLDTGGSSLDNP